MVRKESIEVVISLIQRLAWHVLGLGFKPQHENKTLENVSPDQML